MTQVNPAYFPYGDLFGTSSWHQNIYYKRQTTYRDYPFDVDPSKVIPDGENEGCYAPCTVKLPGTVHEVMAADLSAKMEIDGQKCVLLYRMKGPGEAMNISIVCAAATLAIELPFGTAYHVLRIAFSLVYFIIGTPLKMIFEEKGNWEILDREWTNLTDRLENSLWHIVSGPFFAVAVALSHVFVVLEAVFSGYVASDPFNMRKLSVRLMMLWNDNKPLDQCWWSIAGPQRNFKWLTDYHAFVFPGCYHPVAMGVLNDKGTKVVSVRSFSGKHIAAVDDSLKQVKYNPYNCCGAAEAVKS